MTSTYILPSLCQEVAANFGYRCAYCHTLTAITGARLVIDHIIPVSAGGPTIRENLCLACHSCNEFKGAQLDAWDTQTGEYVRLYHPRRQIWRDHFHWSDDSCRVIGLTPIGRATVVALNMNHETIVEARRRWVRVGWHPPEEDL